MTTEEKSNFTTSYEELKRRKKAFISMLLSILIFSQIFIIGFTIKYPIITLYLTLGYLLFAVSAVWALSITFNNQLKTAVKISENKIIINYHNKEEVIKKEDIIKVRVKRNFRENIREIKITHKERDIYINALGDFEDFYIQLMKFLDKDTETVFFREKINFDHPLYYPIFGLLCAGAFSGLMSLLILIKDSFFTIYQVVVAVFVMLLSIYWVNKKPLTGRYGKKAEQADIITGILLILSGLLIIFVIMRSL